MSLDRLYEAKADASTGTIDTGLVHAGLASWVVEKGSTAEAVKYGTEQGVLQRVTLQYLLGSVSPDGYRGDHDSSHVSSVLAKSMRLTDRMRPDYEGTVHEQRAYLQEISSIGGGIQVEENYYGEYQPVVYWRNGASRFFGTVTNAIPEGHPLADIPIAVVGAGASGILATRALVNLGFNNIDLVDKRGRSNGIWAQDNVAGGSKNNPFSLKFNGAHTPPAFNRTRDDRTLRSGGEITEYIDAIANEEVVHREFPDITKATVTSIEAGDLSHIITMKDSEGAVVEREFPIVICAPGIGLPLHPDRPGHMSTPSTGREAGQRWQKQFSQEELRELEGKRLVLIGLGNSTLEIVMQLQDYEIQTGRKIDYRVLTHYEKDIVDSPNGSHPGRGKIGRDPSIPELTKLATDLPPIATAYNQMNREGKILSNMTSWRNESNIIVATDRDGIETSIPYDMLFTLIGYGQKEETLEKMSITPTDAYLGYGAFDYDGEVQSVLGAEGRERVFPGYFGLGPILKNRYNPNALVIPGIQYQLNDLLASLMLRACEYATTRPDELAQAVLQAEAYRTRDVPRLFPQTIDDTALIISAIKNPRIRQ